MKKIYLIRSAKAENFSEGLSDYERSLRKKGLKDIKTMGSYLLLQGISPDIVLSSCALRAQETTSNLTKILDFKGIKHFLQELYFLPYEEVLKIIMAQDEESKSMFIVGHNPQLIELINSLSSTFISDIPSMGIVALNFEIDEWSEIETKKGTMEFFISPKQFKYYMPQQIRVTLPR